MVAIILGSAKIKSYYHVKNELSRLIAEQGAELLYVVACDGGAKHAKKLGLTPSILVGDMDSIDAELLEDYENSGISIVKYKKEKNFTDSEIGLEAALEKGAEKVIFIGVAGERLDHTFSNIGLLYKCLKKGVTSFMIYDYGIITMICGKFIMNDMVGRTVSLIPYTKKVKKVKTFGLQYPLYKETLKICESRGVSNVVTDSRAGVNIKGGLILVIIGK